LPTDEPESEPSGVGAGAGARAGARGLRVDHRCSALAATRAGG
jgi:hypothetical protein